MYGSNQRRDYPHLPNVDIMLPNDESSEKGVVSNLPKKRFHPS